MVFFGLVEFLIGFVFVFFFYYNLDIKFIFYEVEKAWVLLIEVGWEDSNDNGIVDKEIDGVFMELLLEYKYIVGWQVF